MTTTGAKMRTLGGKMGWMAAMGVVTAGAACDDSSGTGGVAITRAQLAQELSAGPARLELKLKDDGTLREVRLHPELGHEDQVTGRVEAIDLDTGSVTLAWVGAVDGAAVTRWRTDDDSHADGGAWEQAVAAALASGQAVWVDARGDFSAVDFDADELRWEDGGPTKIEADVEPGAFDEATGLLTIGALTFDLTDVSLMSGDDSDDDSDDSSDDSDDSSDVGDDHGDDGPEAGDDNGNDGPEAGDDNGNDGPEAGDDNGNDGAEAGDDNGNDGPEAGDDNGNDGPEAGDDNGNDGAEAGDDNGNDGAEAGDDNGNDAPEAGDDHGGHGGDDAPDTDED